jgi:hypothetical protein
MTKSISFPPSPRPRDVTEDWITKREKPKDRKPTKRLTFELDAEVHLRMKLDCARRGVNMADEIRMLIIARYPEGGQ